MQFARKNRVEIISNIRKLFQDTQNRDPRTDLKVADLKSNHNHGN